MSRVLHLRSSCGLYGADRALIDLASATRAPFEAIVGSIVRPDREDELGDEAKRRGLATLRVESSGKVDFASAKWLAERVREDGISLLHAHDYKSLSIAALIATRVRVPIVATFHGDTGANLSLQAYEALARLLGNTTRAVAAVSEPLAQKLRRWAPFTKVHQIPNGIRLSTPCSDDERAQARAALRIAPDRQVVAVIGRLSKEKGHQVLFRALRVAALHDQPVVLLAGDGELRESLKPLAEGLDVRWLGFVREPRAIYAAADVIAMPSLTEGLPLVGLEAMATGRPLVASAVGELPAMLADHAGFLARPGDEASLAAALMTALGDELARKVAADKALVRVRAQYSLASMAERYAELLYAPAIPVALGENSNGRRTVTG